MSTTELMSVLIREILGFAGAVAVESRVMRVRFSCVSVSVRESAVIVSGIAASIESGGNCSDRIESGSPTFPAPERENAYADAEVTNHSNARNGMIYC